MGSMDGRVALVTGSSVGIGRAIAEAFAREGAAVAMNARTAADIEQAARDVAADTGARTLAVAADISDEAAVRQMVETVEAELGPIDILVNNAGSPGPSAFMQQVELADFERVLRVNVLGTFLCARQVAPGMMERARDLPKGQIGGRIINMSGAGGGQSAVRGGAPYNTSKGAIESFTRTSGLELGGRGVLCAAIMPGRVETRGFPFGEKTPAPERDNAVPPDFAARLAVWLATDAGLDVSGQTIQAPQWAAEHQ